jgi:hypothetical protein
MSRMEDEAAAKLIQPIDMAWQDFAAKLPFAPSHQSYETTRRVFYESAAMLMQWIIYGPGDAGDRIEQAVKNIAKFQETEQAAALLNDAASGKKVMVN